MKASMRKEDLIMLMEYAYQGVIQEYQEIYSIYGDEDETHNISLEFLNELTSTIEENINTLSNEDLNITNIELF